MRVIPFPMEPEPDDLVGIDEAARLTGISRSTLYRRIEAGVLEVHERAIDGLFRVSLRDVRALARFRRRRPVPRPERRPGDEQRQDGTG